MFPWYSLHVRSRSEKLVADALAQKGYEAFLPLWRRERRWSDRVKKVELPLFPSYLFCRFDARQRLPILTTPGVLAILGAGKTPVPVDNDEIAAVDAIVRSGLPAEPQPYMQAGQRVVIADGPLRGVEGFLTAVKNRRRLVVSVNLLRRSVTVDLDQSSVVPLDGRIQQAARA